MNIIKNKLDATDDTEIDCCHRMCKFERNKLKLQAVAYKILHFKDKQKVLQNQKKLENAGILFYEDSSKSIMELRKFL